MPDNFYVSNCNLPSKSLSIIFLIVLLFSGFRAGAQHHRDPWLKFGGGGGGSYSESGYAIALNVDYDTPTGILAPTYKSTPAFNVSVLHYWGNFTFNATIGYHAYSPKQAVFTYDDGAGGTGTVTYDKYSVLGLYAGGVYNLQMGEGARFYVGVNWGIYATHYAFSSQDQFSSDSADIGEEDLYIAPKLGFNFMLNDKMGMGFEAKYNIFTPEGSSDTNPNVGTFYKSYAVGITLSYNL